MVSNFFYLFFYFKRIDKQSKIQQEGIRGALHFTSLRMHSFETDHHCQVEQGNVATFISIFNYTWRTFYFFFFSFSASTYDAKRNLYLSHKKGDTFDWMNEFGVNMGWKRLECNFCNNFFKKNYLLLFSLINDGCDDTHKRPKNFGGSPDSVLFWV